MPTFANDTEAISNVSNDTFKKASLETEYLSSGDTPNNLSVELDNKKDIKLNDSTEKFNEESIKLDLPEERIDFNPQSRISGAHTPNTAFYIPENLLNKTLSDTIGSEQNWYYFETTEKSKISLTLQMPKNSEYDLLLYKYNNGNLDLVSFSQYYGTSEHLSYIAEQGIYFFGIIPYTSVNNEEFLFRIDTITNYDENEPDDNIWFAKEYANDISKSQTIDNSFDEDFFKLNITKNGKTYINLSNISTEKYGVYIYDEKLNIIGSFLGDNKPRIQQFPLGTYYIKVQSYDGKFNPNKEYKLNASTVNSDDLVAISVKGDIISYNNSQISINGKVVPLTWKYEYTS